VLPMAIENDILTAINLTYYEEAEKNLKKTIDLHINHMDKEKYHSYLFTINPDDQSNLQIVSPHTWINYVIAGYNAIINFIEEKHLLQSNPLKEIRLLFTGNVPPSAGLSSSSALTVCSALAFTKIFNISHLITKHELALATINYERRVGTACGGMDQTISIYAEKNQAKLINFYPDLSTSAVNLPSSVSFIIANSLTDSTKVETLAFRYNKRVVENKIGLAIVCNRLNLDKIYSTTIELKSALGLDYKQLENIITTNLKSSAYSLKEIEAEFPFSLGEYSYNLDLVLEKIPHYKEVLAKNDEYKLLDRLLHVCREAERVEKFYQVCSVMIESEEKVNELGSLMNASHKSCKDLYECSSSRLDSLVEYCLENKAVGARLTGAGWGGCCVVMIRNDDLKNLTEKLQDYYREYIDGGASCGDLFFVTKASQGSCIINIS